MSFRSASVNEAGKTVLNVEQQNLGEVVLEVALSLSPIAKQREIKIVRMPRSGPCPTSFCLLPPRGGCDKQEATQGGAR